MNFNKNCLHFSNGSHKIIVILLSLLKLVIKFVKYKDKADSNNSIMIVN